MITIYFFTKKFKYFNEVVNVLSGVIMIEIEFYCL